MSEAQQGCLSPAGSRLCHASSCRLGDLYFWVGRGAWSVLLCWAGRRPRLPNQQAGACLHTCSGWQSSARLEWGGQTHAEGTGF